MLRGSQWIKSAYALLALAAACVPMPPEGALRCASASECPNGWSCRDDGRCWSKPAAHAPDAGSDDGGDADADRTDSGCAGCLIGATCYAPGDACDDGLLCTDDDRCEAGTCAGTPRDCSDGVACNGAESCEERIGCVASEVTCSSGLFCDTSSDTCVSECEDCTFNRSCVADGAINPFNVCERCDASSAPTAWSDNDGAACGDEAATCSAADSCRGGSCEPNHEQEGEPCGDAPAECYAQSACDGEGACVPRPLEAGEACGEAATDCSDQDSCDGEGACLPNHADADTACGDGPTTCSEQDRCDGQGACEPRHLPFGTECRGSAGQCDLAETCNGASDACPTDRFRPNGYECIADADPMTIDTCQTGACEVGADYCDDNVCWVITDSGQTSCFDDDSAIACPGTAGSASCASTAHCGQDAQYAGATRSFVCRSAAGAIESCAGAPDYGDVVEVSPNGLVWQRVSATTGYGAVCDDDASGCTFEQAGAYCDQLSYGGFADWRLPSMRELISVATYEFAGIGVACSDTPIAATGIALWTSTLHVSTGQHANYGGICAAFHINSTDTRYGVRCVRAGPSHTNWDDNPLRFHVLGSGDARTVLDRTTARLWSYHAEPRLTWREALAYCEGLSLAGHDDWRLPSQVEVYTLQNPLRDDGNTTDFPGPEAYENYSSTSDGFDPTYVLTARYNYAYHSQTQKSSDNEFDSARCVRNYP